MIHTMLRLEVAYSVAGWVPQAKSISLLGVCLMISRKLRSCGTDNMAGLRTILSALVCAIPC